MSSSLQEPPRRGWSRQKSFHLSLTLYQQLLYLILPSYNWPSSPLRTLSSTHIHFLHKFFTLLSLNMTKPPQSITSQPYHYTTRLFTPLHEFPCHTFHTHFHCYHPPILSRHMLLSDNSFSQHTLLTVVPYSMSKTLIHTSMLAG